MNLKLAVRSALALAVLPPCANAVDIVNGQYVWRFASEQPWPVGYDQSTGKPDNIT